MFKNRAERIIPVNGQAHLKTATGQEVTTMHLNEGTLKSQEAACRNRLLIDPADFKTRMDLAWCLFLRGVVIAANEEGLAGIGVAPGAGPAGAHEDGARSLMASSLRESLKVCRMSANPAYHAEAARLQFLVEAVGEPEEIAPAESAVENLVRHLAADMSAQGPLSSGLHREVTLSKGNVGAAPAGDRARKGARRHSPRAPHRPSNPGA